MKNKILLICCLFLCAASTLAYIPEEWSVDNVAGDIAKIDELAKKGDVDSLIAMLNATDNEIIKRVIVVNLGDIGDTKAIQPLLNIVPSSDVDKVKPKGDLEQLLPLQILSVVALVRIQTMRKSKSQRVSTLLNLLEPRSHVYHHRAFMQNEVVRALGQIDPKLIPKTYLHHRASYLATLRHQIKDFKREKKIKILLEILTKEIHTSPLRCEAAEELLIEIGKPVTPYLIKILQRTENASIPEGPPFTERHTLINRVITIAMGIGDERTIPALEYLSEVGCLFFKKQATTAIRRIKSGVPYPYKYLRLWVD